jgi:CubicO group peptidase (beta-lactamase class C family)
VVVGEVEDKEGRRIPPVFANDALFFEPGQKWAYNNAGSIALGAIIEKISGRSYFDYVREEIFKPAGMESE